MRTFVAQLAWRSWRGAVGAVGAAWRDGVALRDGARCGRERRVPAGLRTPKEKGAAGNPDSSWWCDMVLAGERLP